MEFDVNPPFVTLRNNSITFSKQAIIALDYPEFVELFCDKQNKKFAVKASTPDSGAMPFYRKPEDGKQLLVRWTNVKIARSLMELAQIEDCGSGIRYYGTCHDDEKIIIFDLFEK